MQIIYGKNFWLHIIHLHVFCFSLRSCIICSIVQVLTYLYQFCLKLSLLQYKCCHIISFYLLCAHILPFLVYLSQSAIPISTVSPMSDSLTMQSILFQLVLLLVKKCCIKMVKLSNYIKHFIFLLLLGNI